MFVGKATVCSLADEQTAAAERRMNGETEASERDIVWQKTQKGLGKLKLGFIFSQKTRKKLCHVSHVLHGLGKLKLGKTLAENAENADFIIHIQLL